MAFPVDILTTVDYESLEQSSKDYMSKLLYRKADSPEYLQLSDSKKVMIIHIHIFAYLDTGPMWNN